MDQVFVVGLDRDKVLRRRAVVRRIRLVGGWFSFVLAMIGMALAISPLFLLRGDDRWTFSGMMMLAMSPALYITGKAIWRTTRLGRWYAAADLPPFAMRMSPAALELGCEGATAPVVLPWPVVPGFRLRRRYGQQVLELAGRIPPGTPGVSGFDQPTVAAALGGDRLLKPAGFYSLGVLDQPVQSIDTALRQFSGGRVGVLSS